MAIQSLHEFPMATHATSPPQLMHTILYTESKLTWATSPQCCHFSASTTRDTNNEPCQPNITTNVTDNVYDAIHNANKQLTEAAESFREEADYMDRHELEISHALEDQEN